MMNTPAWISFYSSAALAACCLPCGLLDRRAGELGERYAGFSAATLN